jgi:predicted outer membrane protein
MDVPGEVTAVRELKGRVQAQVCIASSPTHGSAVVRVETSSAEVQAALLALKRAISKESQAILRKILADQRRWDARQAQEGSE